jgi:hypothetical protein
MNTRLAVALLTLATASLLGHASPASAAGSETPFTAQFAGSLEISGPTRLTLTGHGSATGMGPIATAGQIHMTGIDTSCLGGITNVNTETLTAADGETLSIESLDVACTTGVIKFEGTGNWRVVGGTGRFAGATGGGLTQGRGDWIAGTFAITLTGGIVLAAD